MPANNAGAPYLASRCGLESGPLEQLLGMANRVALAVGPEGGFTGNEIRPLSQAGFRGLRLGPRILRTETAPLAALAILQYARGDLGKKGTGP